MGSKGPGSGTDGRVTGMHADIDTHAGKKKKQNWPLLVDRGVNSDPEALGCANGQLRWDVQLVTWHYVVDLY